MGTMITLAIGEFEIDWGKNSFFTMHGELFQPHDIKRTSYSYVDEDGEPIVIENEAAVRSWASRSTARGASTRSWPLPWASPNLL